MDRYPEESGLFAVVDLEYASRIRTAGDGDLWPSCWADDDHLYTANGDGLGWPVPMGSGEGADPSGGTVPSPWPGYGSWSDIVVSRVAGTPATGLTGERLASGRDVSPVWTDPERFNSKPTGMVAVDGNGDGRDEIYLAVQDLRCGDTPDVFSEAPAAGIVRSDDGGRTWDPGGGVMFTGHRFTTVMFLDFGRSNSRSAVLGEADAGYVYAYGLDHNWRTSTSGCVPDPMDLYLARVPVHAIQDRDAWEFCAGTTGGGDAPRPVWSPDIERKHPVLTDTRRCEVPRGAQAKGGTFIAQGGVTYLPAFDRYAYTSWTDDAWNFYEAPTPWGPWRRFLHQRFGSHPWTGPLSADAKHGGYGVTIPSKYVCEDGSLAHVQSNWFGEAATHTGNTYHFSLRRLRLALAPEEGPGFVDAVPAGQPPAGTNLARVGAHPIGVTFRAGHPEVLHDGSTDRAEDSGDGLVRDFDFWGYTWAEPVRVNRLVYTSGPHDWTSGWFAKPPSVEYRAGGEWVQAPGVEVTPEYPGTFAATGNQVYTLAFDAVTTTGVRMTGRPTGFGQTFSAIAELEAYWDGD